MVVMVQFNPELAKSTPSDALPATSPNGRPGSVYSATSPRDSIYSGSASRHASISSRHSIVSNQFSSRNPAGVGEELDGDDDLPVGHHFTFIPPNPRKYYKKLLEYCIASDLEAMLSPAVGDDDEVSLGILSPPHIELINECALRWRIGQPYRAACFLDIVRSFYERNEVPLECIPEALQTIAKVMSEIEFDKWPSQDVRMMFYFRLQFQLIIYNAIVRISGTGVWWSLQHIPVMSLPCDGFTAQPQNVRSWTVPSCTRSRSRQWSSGSLRR